MVKLVHGTKWNLIKARQELNRSYKEVCIPLLEKCRFLLYEVRPAISIEMEAYKKVNVLYREPRVRYFFHTDTPRWISFIFLWTTKIKMHIFNVVYNTLNSVLNEKMLMFFWNHVIVPYDRHCLPEILFVQNFGK